jgi:GMP synthase (glutamine-hydrolysing)
VLVVQHEDDCPPAWFGEVFALRGIEYQAVLGHRGDPVPATLAGYDGLLVLGGEMGANDDESCPWLSPTKALIAHTVAADGWFLGICLGHQLAAVALGGEVTVNPLGQAFGLTPLALTAQGREDELTSAISDDSRSIQWNSDIVSRLPAGSVRLATAPDGSVQAARFASRAWGLQFHPEASPELFRRWLAHTSEPPSVGDRDVESIAAEIDRAETELRRVSVALAGRWCDLVAMSLSVP